MSFAVEPGEWVALIGPNGAGKTSAAPRVCGLVPFDGEIARRRRATCAQLGRRELARLVAFVPQTPETPPELTVAEYVLLGRTPHIGYFARRGRADRAPRQRALDRLELAAVRRAPARLAQRRRAAARRARARARAGGADSAARRADDARSTSAASSRRSSSSTRCAATG